MTLDRQTTMYKIKLPIATTGYCQTVAELTYNDIILNPSETNSKFMLGMIQAFTQYVEHYKLQNEQWYLDYLDELNKISVSY
jgi:hypothetical protein